MTYKKYFAYGSNMSERRLRSPCRVPGAKVIAGAYRLKFHDLRFHKLSKKDGSGKCDAYRTCNEDDFIWGRLFDIPSSEEGKLDKVEGLNKGYEKKPVDVIDRDGNVTKAFTYYASCTHIVDSLRPYTWYKEHVLVGAGEARLPDDYIEEKINTVTAVEDPDSERARKERALHKDSCRE